MYLKQLTCIFNRLQWLRMGSLIFAHWLIGSFLFLAFMSLLYNVTYLRLRSYTKLEIFYVNLFIFCYKAMLHNGDKVWYVWQCVFGNIAEWRKYWNFSWCRVFVFVQKVRGMTKYPTGPNRTPPDHTGTRHCQFREINFYQLCLFRVLS